VSFPRYPKYKVSGVEWLGEVPEHWDVMPLKHVAEFVNGAAFQPSEWADEGTPIIRIQNLNGGEEFNFFKGELEDRYIVRNGDLLFGWSGNRGTSFGPFIWEKPGTFALNQHIFRVHSRELDIRPLYWLLKAVTAHVEEQAHGIIGMVHVTKGDLGAIRVPVVSAVEARAIAHFLERELARIDALIAEQQRLVQLLNEKRRAVISHAVTKGVNSDAPMKASGVEWMGEVPDHWSVLPLARVTLSCCDGPFGSGLKSDHYTDEGVRVVRLQNISTDGFAAADAAFIDADYFERELGRHAVTEGDVLVAGLGDDNNSVGRACVAPEGIEPAMVKADCFRFRLDRAAAVPEFVARQLSAGAPADAGTLATGSTRSRIPLSVMSARSIALPPVSEQHLINAYLSTQSRALEELVAESEQAVSLLQERRTTLIAAAVTGKIDVRGFVDADAA
jgi:type I restriction enzyme S subunit